MSKLILTRGVPASGKTTWAKAWVAEDDERRVRLNRDDFRMMLFGIEGVGTFPQEKAVSAAQQTAARALLVAGIDVVIDDTNLRAKFVKMWLGMPAEVICMDFPITYEEAVARDLNREARGERGVGGWVIKSFFDKFIGKDGISLPPVPVLSEVTPRFKVVEPYDTAKPDAIIVDLDGTLAHIVEGGRSPYDGHLVGEDSLDLVVAEIVKLYYEQNVTILITSGRDEAFRSICVEWLQHKVIPYNELIMRPEGDTRQDAIVKDELYEKYIAPHYNVLFALDDRNRVVDMWRAKGIKCLQVQPGDF